MSNEDFVIKSKYIGTEALEDTDLVISRSPLSLLIKVVQITERIWDVGMTAMSPCSLSQPSHGPLQ